MKALPKALAAGIVAFAVLFALGAAVAPDVPNDEDTNNTLGATVSSTSPIITAFDLTDASDVSFMHAQIDVNTTFYFNVTVEDPDGWGDLQWTNIHVWFDGGATELAFDAQTTGPNYKADLNYTNVAPTSDPALGEWSVAEGNLVYDSGNSSIFTNVVNQNYTFKLAFYMEHQMRQAIDPAFSGTANYDDLNSWNAEVRAKDFGNPDVFNRQNSTDVYHEFGVFRFTNVSIASDWNAGTISPGSSGTTAAVTVTHQANRDYKLRVWFDTHLVDGVNTIDVTNINITAAGDAGDNITADISFAGLGSGNSEYIRGTTTWFWGHDVSGNSTTTGVQFRVFAPFGTPSGSYVANLTIRVET